MDSFCDLFLWRGPEGLSPTETNRARSGRSEILQKAVYFLITFVPGRDSEGAQQQDRPGLVFGVGGDMVGLFYGGYYCAFYCAFNCAFNCAW